MRSVDDVELFEVFLIAAANGSLGTTARELRLSRGTVSRRLALLEEKLGMRLFLREAEGVRLTKEGRSIKPAVERFVERFNRLCTPASGSNSGAFGEDRRTIQISAPSSIGNGLLIPWLKLFQDSHPDVLIDLVLTLGPVRLMPPGCDIRINHGLFPLERVNIRPLGSMLRIMVASADYLARHGIPKHPEDLKNHSLLGGNDLLNGNPLIVTNGRERILIPYMPRLRLRDHTAARSAALAGAGIDVHAFRYDTFSYVKRGELIQILPDWQPETTPVSMLLPATRPLGKTARDLADFIEAKWRAHPDLESFSKGFSL